MKKTLLPLSILFAASLIYYSPPVALHFSPSASKQHETPSSVKTETKPVVTDTVVVDTPKSTPSEPRPVSNTAPESSTPAGAAPTTAPTSVDFATNVELAVFAATNAERGKEGLAPLSNDPLLAQLARAHSADMIERNYFSHDDPDGCGSSCRANAADYEWTRIGENIYMSSGYDVSATEEAHMTVEGWMNSAGHRANILGEYTATGIGVVIKGESVYVTAMYATPH
jgi:uncharacterized protein YkwD